MGLLEKDKNGYKTTFNTDVMAAKLREEYEGKLQELSKIRKMQLAWEK